MRGHRPWDCAGENGGVVMLNFSMKSCYGFLSGRSIVVTDPVIDDTPADIIFAKMSAGVKKI
jgi:hypothetical protein